MTVFEKKELDFCDKTVIINIFFLKEINVLLCYNLFFYSFENYFDTTQLWYTENLFVICHFFYCDTGVHSKHYK